jgi:hypothetical protein
MLLSRNNDQGTTMTKGNDASHRRIPDARNLSDAGETDGNECELSVASAECEADLAVDRFVKESVRQRMRRLTTLM